MGHPSMAQCVSLVFGGATRHTMPQSYRTPRGHMLDSKPLLPRADRDPQERPRLSAHDPAKQQRLMLTALGLLLFALGFVLYSNRDFWFPDASSAVYQPPSAAHAATAAPQLLEHHPVAATRKPHSRALAPKPPDPPDPPGTTVTATRTVLPPLEVQVVAGNTPRTLHPTNNSVQVDLQQGSAPSRVLPEIPVKTDDTAANITSNAAERAEVSADTSEVVSHSVTPGYPTLARQMKVQGSVVLMAMIGRDGLIQDLHVLSGPPILANAAQEAVRQWHFKPHYQGIQAVETQARITVNFTISTN